MAVRAPIELVPQLAQMRASTPSTMATLLGGAGKFADQQAALSKARQEADRQALTTILTHFNITPNNPAIPPTGGNGAAPIPSGGGMPGMSSQQRPGANLEGVGLGTGMNLNQSQPNQLPWQQGGQQPAQGDAPQAAPLPLMSNGSAGVTFGDMLKTLNRGRIPAGIPPGLLAMNVTPKSEMNALSRILPSIINNQEPGKSVNVMGGLTQPGAVPGLSPNATVTGKEKSSSRGGSGGIDPQDRIFNQALNAARSMIGQKMQQALADPSSANVKKFPILDPKASMQMYFDSAEKEAAGRGAKPEEIKKRIGPLKQQLLQQADDYSKQLISAKTALKRKAISKEEVRKRLLENFPDFVMHINNDPELR